MDFQRRVFGHRILELMPAGLSVCAEGCQGHAAVVLRTLLPSICVSQVAASLMLCRSSSTGVSYDRGQVAATAFMTEEDGDDSRR